MAPEQRTRFATSVAVFLLAASVFAQTTVTGKVVGISDGDTITVLLSGNRQLKVRLAGIDAPEKGQDYANSAKQALSSLVYGETVRLEGRKIDRYGRRVAKVIAGGEDVNLKLVQRGLAWHFKKYESEQSLADRRLYAAAEMSARKARLNIWRYENPVAPWDYRAGTTSSPQVVTLASSHGGSVIGNRNSMIYHLPSCPSYSKVAERNRVYFRTREEAEKAGYRMAKNC